MSKHDLNSQYHKEHQEWLKELDFYSDEIKIFQKELSVIMDRHPDQFSITEHSDEYKQIFHKKLEEINKLRQQMQLHEHELTNQNEPINDEIWDHETTRVNLLDFVNRFEKLKKNFRRFVSRQM